MGARATGLSIPSDQKQEKANDGTFRKARKRQMMVRSDLIAGICRLLGGTAAGIITALGDRRVQDDTLSI